MSGIGRRLLDALLGFTRLELLPVRVRSGFATGARWTLYPWTSYWRGTHEPDLQSALSSAGDMTGWSCWDLGAHFGLYSVGFAQRVGPTGEVAAFEPNPLSFRRLARHRRMNRLAWLKIYAAAVSDRPGVTELLTYGSLRSTTTHLAYEDETRTAESRPLEVQTVVLDQLVASGAIRAPDLVKVDVEGHAHHALAGARESIAAKRPILVVGIHSPQELGGVVDLLEPLGYQGSAVGRCVTDGESLVGRDVLFRPSAEMRRSRLQRPRDREQVR